MGELAELHRFNAWANRSLLAGVRQLSAARVEEQREGSEQFVVKGYVGANGRT